MPCLTSRKCAQHARRKCVTRKAESALNEWSCSGNGGSAGAAAELTCALESVLLRLGKPGGHGQWEKPGICIAPSNGRDKRGKRAVLQANRIALAFGGEPQDAAREFVGPHLAVAVEL